MNKQKPDIFHPTQTFKRKHKSKHSSDMAALAQNRIPSVSALPQGTAQLIPSHYLWQLIISLFHVILKLQKVPLHTSGHALKTTHENTKIEVSSIPKRIFGLHFSLRSLD